MIKEDETSYHQRFLETGLTVILHKPGGEPVRVEGIKSMGEVVLAALENGALIPQRLVHLPTGELAAPERGEDSEYSS